MTSMYWKLVTGIGNSCGVVLDQTSATFTEKKRKKATFSFLMKVTA